MARTGQNQTQRGRRIGALGPAKPVPPGPPSCISTYLDREVGMISNRIAEFGLLAGRGALLGLVILLVVVLGSALPMGLQWLLKW